MKLATQYSQLENRGHGFVFKLLIYNEISHSSTPSFLKLSQTNWQTTYDSYNLLLPVTPWLTIHTNWGGPRVRLTTAAPRAREICHTERDQDNAASRNLPNHCLRDPLKSVRSFVSLALLLSFSRAFWLLGNLSNQEKKKRRRKTHHSIDPWRHMMLWDLRFCHCINSDLTSVSEIWDMASCLSFLHFSFLPYKIGMAYLLGLTSRL